MLCRFCAFLCCVCVMHLSLKTEHILGVACPLCLVMNVELTQICQGVLGCEWMAVYSLATLLIRNEVVLLFQPWQTVVMTVSTFVTSCASSHSINPPSSCTWDVDLYWSKYPPETLSTLWRIYWYWLNRNNGVYFCGFCSDLNSNLQMLRGTNHLIWSYIEGIVPVPGWRGWKYQKAIIHSVNHSIAQGKKQKTALLPALRRSHESLLPERRQALDEEKK